jgi:hypothetical protein
MASHPNKIHHTGHKELTNRWLTHPAADLTGGRRVGWRDGDEAEWGIAESMKGRKDWREIKKAEF